MKLNFRWVKKTGDYSTGERLMLNRLHIGGYSWNCSSQQDPAQRWRGQVSLPSIKNDGWAYGASEEEIKTNMEAVVKQWFCEAVSA